MRSPHAAGHGVSGAGDADVGCTGARSRGRGPPRGIERCRRTRWKQGARSKAMRDLLRANRQLWRALLVLIGE